MTGRDREHDERCDPHNEDCPCFEALTTFTTSMNPDTPSAEGRLTREGSRSNPRTIV